MKDKWSVNEHRACDGQTAVKGKDKWSLNEHRACDGQTAVKVKDKWSLNEHGACDGQPALTSTAHVQGTEKIDGDFLIRGIRTLLMELWGSLGEKRGVGRGANERSRANVHTSVLLYRCAWYVGVRACLRVCVCVYVCA